MRSFAAWYHIGKGYVRDEVHMTHANNIYDMKWYDMYICIYIYTNHVCLMQCKMPWYFCGLWRPLREAPCEMFRANPLILIMWSKTTLPPKTYKDIKCMSLFHNLTLNHGKLFILPIWWWKGDKVNVFSQRNGKLNTQSPCFARNINARIDFILDTHPTDCT